MSGTPGAPICLSSYGSDSAYNFLIFFLVFLFFWFVIGTAILLFFVLVVDVNDVNVNVATDTSSVEGDSTTPLRQPSAGPSDPCTGLGEDPDQERKEALSQACVHSGGQPVRM